MVKACSHKLSIGIHIEKTYFRPSMMGFFGIYDWNMMAIFCVKTSLDVDQERFSTPED